MSCCSPNKKKDDARTRSSCCSSHPKEKKEHSEDKDEQSHSSCCAIPKNEKKSPLTITRHMTIEQILNAFPYKAQRLAQEITDAGLHCIGCQAAVWETLEGGMLSHQKTEAQIDELVRRLNALLEEEIDYTTIRLTPRGAAKFLEILASEGKQGVGGKYQWGMRFSEELAGCSGFEYVLDFSEKAEEDDEIFHSCGVEIHVKKALVPHLLGSEIDYVESLRGKSGFRVSNPGQRSTCACGNSHNYS